MLFYTKAANVKGDYDDFVGVYQKGNPDVNVIFKINDISTKELSHYPGLTKPIFEYKIYVDQTYQIELNNVWDTDEFKPKGKAFQEVSQRWKDVKNEFETSHNIQSQVQR